MNKFGSALIRGWVVIFAILSMVVVNGSIYAEQEDSDEPADLTALSLEDLMNIEVRGRAKINLTYVSSYLADTSDI
jgi:hypothetical protein